MPRAWGAVALRSHFGLAVGLVVLMVAFSTHPAIAQPDLGWGGPTVVDQHLQGPASDPQIAMDPIGRATVVWRHVGGGIANIWGNRYIPGFEWRAPRLVEAIGGDASEPQVAMDANGNAVSVWRQGNSVFENRFVVGSGWGTPTALESEAPPAEDPQIAMAPGGNATAVWRQSDGANTFDIYASRYVLGSGWETPTTLETSIFSAREPQVAMEVGGYATVVWEQSDGTFQRIYASRYAPGFGWSVATLIDAGPGLANQPQVAMDENGHAMAVWVQTQNGSSFSVYASRYVPGTGWGAAALLENDLGFAFDPQVALDGLSNAIAVWRQVNGTVQTIYANRFAPGFGWGVAEVIDGGASDSFGPQVALDRGGNATAVWYQDDGAYLSIHANRLLPGIGWGAPSLIEALTENAFAPQVAEDDSGDATAVWQHSDAMGGSSVYASRYASGAWGPATLVEYDDWGDATQHQVAMDIAGNAIAVWSQPNGGTQRVVASHFEPGRGWTIPIRIDRGRDFLFAVEPSVAFDDSGRAVVIWVQFDGAALVIYARHYDPDAGWGFATAIGTGANIPSAPQVAVDASGRATAVWREHNGVDWSFHANRYEPGTGWDSPTVLGANASLVGAPQVAMEVGGNALAVWHQDDGAYLSIYARRYVLGLGWEPVQVIDAGAGVALEPDVAMDASGRGVAVWRQFDETSYSVFASRFVPGTGWEGAVPIDAGTHESSMPQIAMNPTGTAVALWRQRDASTWRVYANRYLPGSGWGSAALIDPNAGEAISPQVAVDVRGRAVAAWQQRDGSFWSIYANRFTPESGWGSAVRLDPNEGDGLAPKVAVDGGGNALAVWTQSDGTRRRVYANRFVEGTGVPELVITAPTETLTNDASVTVAGRTDPGVMVTIDGAPVGVDPDGAFSSTISLPDGLHIFEIEAVNTEGKSNSVTVTITVDTIPPPLVLTSPADGETSQIPAVTVAGTTEPGALVVVNGVFVAVGSGGGFSMELALVEGENVITVVARDSAGNLARESLTVTFLNPLPGLEEDLQDARSELDATQDSLGATQDEVDAAQALLASQGNQLLVALVLLVVFAGLTGFLIVAYLRGRARSRR